MITILNKFLTLVLASFLLSSLPLPQAHAAGVIVAPRSECVVNVSTRRATDIGSHVVQFEPAAPLPQSYTSFLIEVVAEDSTAAQTVIAMTTGTREGDIAWCQARYPGATDCAAQVEADIWSATKLSRPAMENGGGPRSGLFYGFKKFLQGGQSVVNNGAGGLVVDPATTYTWESVTRPYANHAFYFVSYGPACDTPGTSTGAVIETGMTPGPDIGASAAPADNRTFTDDATSHKIATQVFNASSQAPNAKLPSGSSVAPNLVFVRYDPNGYIFDTKTFLPVKGTPAGPFVHIYEQKNGVYGRLANKMGEHNIGVLDYDTPNQNGIFSFLVFPGTYALDVYKTPAPIGEAIYSGPVAAQSLMTGVVSIPRGYTVVNENGKTVGKVMVTIDNAPRELYRNIYPVDLGQPEAIVEGTAVERRDIPVDATLSGLDTVAFSAPLPLANPQVDGGVAITGLSNLSYGRIQVFADNINAAAVPPSREIPLSLADRRANAEGNYTLIIAPRDFHAETETLRVTRTISEVYGANAAQAYDLQAVAAASQGGGSSVQMFPLYLSGVAKSDTGIPLADAEVRVVQDDRVSPSAVVLTDANGAYSIPGYMLPAFPYHLEYAGGSAAGTRSVMVNEAVKENQAYLASTNTDLFSPVQANVVAQKAISEKRQGNDISPNNGGPIVQAPIDQVAPPLAGAQMTMMTFVLLTLLILVTGILVYVYMKRKGSM